MKKSSGKVVRYNKWGYIFLIPFIVVYVIFQLIPLVSTIYNSFFENYMSGLTQVGPKFVGLANYQKLFSDGDIWVYTKNTMVLWIMCFVPQIILSLVLGAWFSDVQVIVDENRIQSISLVSLDETVATMYPLMEPALENVSEQVIKQQSTEGITYRTDNQYTSIVLLNAIENALAKAEIAEGEAD